MVACVSAEHTDVQLPLHPVAEDPDAPAAVQGCLLWRSEQIQYIFGSVTSSADAALSTATMDYHLCFINSLDQNDGLGTAGTQWNAYKADEPAVLELNNEKLEMIPDAYRAAGIGAINENILIFHR